MKNCEHCKKQHDGKYASGRFCSLKCAKQFAALSNKIKANKKVSMALKNKPLRNIPCAICGSIVKSNCTNSNIHCDKCRIKRGNTPRRCRRCGALRGQCKHSNLCRKNERLFNNLNKYFGFDLSSFGSERYYEEIFRVKSMLEEDYFDNEMSLPELADKYEHSNIGNFSKLLTSIGIIFRNCQEASILCHKQGKIQATINPRYKHGWHTTWDNKKVFYRSSYELDYAKILDEKKIKYEMENLRIVYFDTKRCIERIAVPDFYLPEFNKIIEIKSSFTYDKQNMDDKIKSYKNHGYKFKLILDHEEV